MRLAKRMSLFLGKAEVQQQSQGKAQHHCLDYELSYHFPPGSIALPVGITDKLG